MKIKFYIIALLFFGGQLKAQIPEDALRMSWNVPFGTARNQAIGGAMGSLGGEITSIFVNPAGLGLYKTGEVVLSPGFSFLKGKSNFRGTDAASDRLNKFNFGTSGVVWGYSNRYSQWKSSAFSLAVNRLANFNNRTYYKGENDFSSFSEMFAEEFSRSNLPIDVRLYDAPLSLGTKLANYSYLIDTVTVGGQTEVVGLPQRDAILSGTSAMLNQEKDISTKGGITEFALGFAANREDKFYFGATLGVPIVNYERKAIISESDASGITNNNFNYARYQENYSSKGFGINAKLGLLYKPIEYLRLGLALHTPSMYSLKEKSTGSIEADLENYFPPSQRIRIANEDSIYTQFGVMVPEFEYDLISPWKFLLSASYVLREAEDITKQKGFLTADVEYVTHGSSRFSSTEEYGDDSFYQDVNEAVKMSYKGAFNFRVGGELKFKTIMTRLGFAWYGNPYEQKELKARKMNVSGGLGYRNKGIFVDLAYVHSLNKDVDFPYRLSDKANTFAALKESNGNVLLTLGFKF